MARTYPPRHCPDSCSGGNPDRQMAVNEGILRQLPEDVQGSITEHGSAQRCSYCGLVYLSPTPEYGGRLGFWDSGISGEGWTQ